MKQSDKNYRIRQSFFAGEKEVVDTSRFKDLHNRENKLERKTWGAENPLRRVNGENYAYQGVEISQTKRTISSSLIFIKIEWTISCEGKSLRF